MKLNLMKFSLKANIAILLLLFLLIFAFSSCNKEELPATTNTKNQSTTPLLSPDKKADNTKYTAFGYWKKRIEKIATAQQFDCFQVNNEEGITLHEFSADDLKFNYHSPKNLMLISQDERVLIPWKNIISISKVTNDHYTTYVLSQDGLVDRNIAEPTVNLPEHDQAFVYKNKVNIWKKQIEKLAKTQNFDAFIANNEKGETIYKWSVKDLKFDYRSDVNLILLYDDGPVVIPWKMIISISEVTNDYHTTYVLPACGLADRNALGSNKSREAFSFLNASSQVVLSKNGTRNDWRNIIEKLDKNKQFDLFIVKNRNGKTLYQWSVEELKFDYDSPPTLTLIGPDKQLVIPWSKIISIINETTDSGTTYVLAKDGLAD